ncbi:MAG: four helix bundle protein [Verrucomicrobiales bacterium]|jgi:four helix bundle protein|nr:four helix bundle protein [Verrucomicrobiales bacterium]
MAYQSFENLEVWQRACRLTVQVFQTFGDCKLYALRDQITRAALSVPSNIAEGAERGTKKEFARFLDIAKGSGGEFRTQLYIAKKLRLIKEPEFKTMKRESTEISAMLEGLRRTLKT